MHISLCVILVKLPFTTLAMNQIFQVNKCSHRSDLLAVPFEHRQGELRSLQRTHHEELSLLTALFSEIGTGQKLHLLS